MTRHYVTIEGSFRSEKRVNEYNVHEAYVEETENL